MDSYRPGIASGKLVRRHNVQWDGTYLNIQSDLLLKGGFDSSIVEQPKLLVRQTGDRIISALDDSGLYHLNNVHSFSPPEGLGQAEPVVSEYLLNSNFWLYLYQLKVVKKVRLWPRLTLRC